MRYLFVRNTRRKQAAEDWTDTHTEHNSAHDDDVWYDMFFGGFVTDGEAGVDYSWRSDPLVLC